MLSKLKLVLFVLLMSLFSCNQNKDLDQNGNPNNIVIAIYGSGDNQGSLRKALEPTRQHLENKLNKPVSLIFGTDYTTIIEAMVAKKAHIAYMSPFSYILAKRKNAVTPLVVVGENGRSTIYHSIIMSSKKSGITSIEQLKSQSKNLSICFSDPASASGHLVPRGYLTTIGLDPDKTFKQSMFAGSHQASMLSVASGKVDIGCSTIEYGLNIMIKKGLIKPEDVNIIWTSDAIVASPLVIRSDINPSFAQEVKNIYLNMAKENPNAFGSYIKTFKADINNLSYVPIEDSMYNGLRKIADGIKDLSEIK
jgi:phosphonate transport system substrate-binding protein